MTDKRVPFLNTYIDNLSHSEAVDYVDKWIQSGRIGSVITPNVDQIIQLEKKPELRKVWNSAELLLLDGHPLLWISRFYRRPFKEKISGSDFVPEVCRLAAARGYSVFLMGAAPGVADRAAENLKKSYPEIRIAGTMSPSYGFEKDPEEVAETVRILKASKADILVLGLGVPKQELYAHEHMEQYGIPVTLCTGAAIDFIAGSKKRAPKWMRNMGLEWLYRMCQEPGRIAKRVFRDLEIARLVVKYRPKRAEYGKKDDKRSAVSERQRER